MGSNVWTGREGKIKGSIIMTVGGCGEKVRRRGGIICLGVMGRGKDSCRYILMARQCGKCRWVWERGKGID